MYLKSEQRFGFRHVRLTCGTRVLSEARNWFVPDRLTVDMNHTLTETDIPFGEAVAALAFRRDRLESIKGPGFPDSPPETILTHRALLRRPDGLPIALVVECYQPGALSPA
ncbi:hypothetical protein [Novosphingobium sp. 9]|uniref:hypothetical protein n=1 Tax=Novosphingobium sp. 9 TaxID=2025349 RepID=UPI0021B61AC1|nr:hypothetical protein [Novosphingobium sp. 9]